MTDIDIKRGYEILTDNSLRLGIRITNNTNSVINKVQVLLDYNDSLFQLIGERFQSVDSIPPTVPRTLEFILKPIGCVHKEYIEATITYRDQEWKKHILTMEPKEIHCVCPFLRAKPMSTSKFLEIFSTGTSVDKGLNIDGIGIDKIRSMFMETCNNRLYQVAERNIEDGKILYLSSESIGEKATYLLTVLIKENSGITQVMLRAVSDKEHGLHGFVNEIITEIQHLISTQNSAKEIGHIKNEQVINIIDSVVQRSNFETRDNKKNINVEESIIQSSSFTGLPSKSNFSGMEDISLHMDKPVKMKII